MRDMYSLTHVYHVTCTPSSYEADSYQQYNDGIFGDHNKLSKFGKGNNDIFGCPQAIW